MTIGGEGAAVACESTRVLHARLLHGKACTGFDSRHRQEVSDE